MRLSGARFWILLTIFQVVFGLVVFAFTRQYYLQDPDQVSASPAVQRPPSLAWPDDSTAADLARDMSASPGPSAVKDPVAISRLADDFYVKKKYKEAAALYQQLLASGSNDVNTYNSLGITLHYLGQSTEALRILNEGVAMDSSYQRIWLTLGFVNSQLGNIEQARSALTTAVQMGADNEIGQAAAEMLEDLP